jgi:hypothetical protein
MSRLHSIYLTGGGAAEALPARLAANVASLRDQHPELPHTLYDDASLRDFIRTHIGRDALQAYDALLPLAYKADLGRYCLLHEFGGIYADLSVYFFYPVRSPGEEGKLHVFRDSSSAAPWIVSNSLIASPPRHPVFRACIEQVIAHCRSRHYGVNPLCPTGPNLFGRAIALGAPLEQLVAGDTVRMNRTETHAHAYLTPAGEVVAVNVKRGAGLASLGARLGEDYNRHYWGRNVYGELAGRLSWSRKDYLERGWGTVADGASASEPWLMQPGLALRGPGASLAPGAYLAQAFFYGIAAVKGDAHLEFAVVCDGGQRVLARSRAMRIDERSGGKTYGVQFELGQTARDVELRMWLSAPTRVLLGGVQISRAAAPGQSAAAGSTIAGPDELG